MDYKNLNVNTRRRLTQFANSFNLESWTGRSMNELFQTLIDSVAIDHSEELDAATQLALQTAANRWVDSTIENSASQLSMDQTDRIFHHFAAELYTSYVIGRAMLGTGQESRHFSNPSNEGQNADLLVQRFFDQGHNDYLSDAGGTPRLWEHFRTQVAAGGPFSLFPVDHQQALATAASRGGMILAVLEHDTFVEGGGSSVAAPDDLEYVAKLSLAALKVNQEMGLDALAPGTGVLALLELDAMASSFMESVPSGELDGFRNAVVGMTKSLSVRERDLLGFSITNNYPAKAVEYLKALVLASVELGFTNYSTDFVREIQLQPPGS